MCAGRIFSIERDRAALLDERIEEWNLRAKDAFARLVKRKPVSAINLGNLDHAVRARRPFDLAQVADQRLRIAVAFDSPARNKFPRRLADNAQFKERPLYREARFFLELAQGGGKRFLALNVLAFRDGPCAKVFLHPERPAWVNEKNFQFSLTAAEQQDPRAAFCHKKAPL